MVSNIDHDLDVEGDVILNLLGPNEPFAVWADEFEPWELPRPPPPVLDDYLAKKFRRLDPACPGNQKCDELQSFDWDGFQQDPLPVPIDPPEAEPLDTEPTDTEPPEAEASELPVDLLNPPMEETSDLSNRSEGLRPKQTRPEDDEVVSNGTSQVRFRLSSRHLISASPYFKAMLTGPWEESSLRARSLYSISATSWDEDALKLLMDIIHGNSQNVPRSIGLELLAKIAVLVDYYKCYDVVKFYADTWIEGLDGFVETPRYSRGFVLILFISCVFFQPVTFRILTHQAMLQTQGPLQLLELPFPGGLIEEIERRRVDAVGSLFDGIHDLLKYLTTRDLCTSGCSAILVGSLYRWMFAQGILSPRPARPFHGICVEHAVKMARDVQSPRWSDPDAHDGRRHRNTTHTCCIPDILGPLADQVTDSLDGLELENYVENPWLKLACTRAGVPSSAS